MKIEGHAATFSVLMPFIVFLLVIGEPDLLDAITNRISSVPAIANSMDTTISHIQSEAVKESLRLDRQETSLTTLRGTTLTNFNVIIQVLQRHEQAIQQLSTNKPAQ